MNHTDSVITMNIERIVAYWKQKNRADSAPNMSPMLLWIGAKAMPRIKRTLAGQQAEYSLRVGSF
jgi:hypothetical protein